MQMLTACPVYHYPRRGLRRVKMWSVTFLKQVSSRTFTAEMVKKKTQVDPILSLVYRYVQNGWPSIVDASLVPYKNKQG